MWDPAAIVTERVAAELSFPTSVTFDPFGTAYVAEAGLDFDGPSHGGRIWALPAEGDRVLVADGLDAPVNGLTCHDGDLFVSEARGITRIGVDGRRRERIVKNLPGPGNYQTNMVAVGPDGRLYFSQGAMTNSGIVGLDGFSLAWLRRVPHAHDIPGYDVELVGLDVETTDPRASAENGAARTGAFAPFGTPGEPGRRVTGAVPCTAAIMRCDPDGGHLELVAWGVRNAYGLGFLPDGRLLAIDQGADDRGSRPIGNAPDLLYEIRSGAWYGWPDFIGGEPVTSPEYVPERGAHATFVLANHGRLPAPERPLVRFAPHAAAVKFDIGPAGSPWEGTIVVALFGDERPLTASGGPRVGRALACVQTTGWSMTTQLFDQFVRPIDVRFHPIDHALYVLDFGEFEMSDHGPVARGRTGALWRIATRPRSRCSAPSMSCREQRRSHGA